MSAVCIPRGPAHALAFADGGEVVHCFSLQWPDAPAAWMWGESLSAEDAQAVTGPTEEQGS